MCAARSTAPKSDAPQGKLTVEMLRVMCGEPEAARPRRASPRATRDSGGRTPPTVGESGALAGELRALLPDEVEWPATAWGRKLRVAYEILFAIDERIESTRTLAETLGVSRKTAQRYTDALESMTLITIEPGVPGLEGEQLETRYSLAVHLHQTQPGFLTHNPLILMTEEHHAHDDLNTFISKTSRGSGSESPVQQEQRVKRLDTETLLAFVESLRARLESPCPGCLDPREDRFRSQPSRNKTNGKPGGRGPSKLRIARAALEHGPNLTTGDLVRHACLDPTTVRDVLGGLGLQRDGIGVTKLAKGRWEIHVKIEISAEDIKRMDDAIETLGNETKVFVLQVLQQFRHGYRTVEEAQKAQHMVERRYHRELTKRGWAERKNNDVAENAERASLVERWSGAGDRAAADMTDVRPVPPLEETVARLKAARVERERAQLATRNADKDRAQCPAIHDTGVRCTIGRGNHPIHWGNPGDGIHWQNEEYRSRKRRTAPGPPRDNLMASLHQSGEHNQLTERRGGRDGR